MAKCCHYTPAEDSSVWASMHRQWGCPDEGAKWPHNPYLEKEMAKADNPRLHGDPRHHSDDIAELKARIKELERENDALHRQLENRDWRSVGW